MHTFRTVPDIRIESGGVQKLDHYVEGICRNNRIAIITDKGIRQLNLIDSGIAALEDVGYNVMVFDQIIADPPEDIVVEGAKAVKEFGAGLVIGFGGGSSMDAAKVIAHLAGINRPIALLYGVGAAKGPSLPLLLIPTTAGTGSEVTNIAIITTDKTEKKGIVADALYADRVLLDASLTLGLPTLITASTGIDAMVHAIEAYTSIFQKNPLSDTLALSALTKLWNAIERACKDGNDVEARNDMLIGSMLAGQAFSNAPCAAIHALAYPLGGFFHVPHGLSNALVMTGVMKFNQPKAKVLYSQIAEHLRIGTTSIALIDELQRIKDITNVPQSLSCLGINSESIPMMAKDAMTKTRLLINNPRKMTYKATVKIYENIA